MLVQKREMRSHYRLFRRYFAAACNHLIPSDGQYLGMLIDIQIFGESIQELQRVKLRLIAEFHCTDSRNRQRQVAGKFRSKSDLFQCRQFIFNLSKRIRCVYKRVLSLKITVDLAAQLPVFLQRRQIGFKIHPRSLHTVFSKQLIINQTMLGCYLGGSVSGDALTDPIRLDKHVFGACLFQHIGA